MTNAMVPATASLSKAELSGSKLFPAINTPAKAAVAMKMAQSYGLCPTVIANGLYFVGGKPALSANVIASLVMKNPKYKYRVKAKTDTECSIEFFEKDDGKWESLGVETFTIKMAQRAKLTGGVNWQKFPEAMLWARCLTAGVRARCPDALGGNYVYSVEELSPGTEIDAEGRPVMEAEYSEASPPSADQIKDLIAKTDTDEAKLLAFYDAKTLGDLTEAQRFEVAENLTLKLED